MKYSPVLVIHGGAGSGRLHGEKYQAYAESVARILSLVYPDLLAGGSALEAVVQAAALLEDDELFNAGKGSKIQSDGKIRMSASVMDGSRKRFAGCINVERLKNPVRLAHHLLDQEDRVLSDKGAIAYAKKLGLKFGSPFTERRMEEFKKSKKGKSGTIGAIALDSKGRLAAATSTGGRGGEYPYRVSDSATCAGNFANAMCAVSATGTGEEIVEAAVSSTLCAYVDAGLPFGKSGERIIRAAKKSKHEFGFIALDKKGNYQARTSTRSLIWGAATREWLEIFDEV